MEPKIIIEDWQGRHNASDYTKRLEDSKSYRDLSTVCIVPTRGVISARVVQNWMGMITPMNQKFMRMFIIGMEVGAAYQTAVENILAHPDLSQWKYILTLEEDNMAPPDGLIKLYESIDDFDAIGGLYWTKGPGGQPMCYGDPNIFPINFIPQVPAAESVTRCNGLGMGFTLFKLEMFKKMPKPWFQTVQRYEPGTGIACYTQDLYFFEQATKAGFKFACDSRVKVGHFEKEADIVW
jgi:hypothetical protein